MLPRRKLDIGWTDLLCALGSCMWPRSRTLAGERVEALWDSTETVACLSVRSGLDALLQALALPRGSEVLVSAVTIRDMIRILEEHKLVAVPLDVRMDALAVDAESIARLAGPRTRAVLIAHFFGSRMPLEGIAAAAKGCWRIRLAIAASRIRQRSSYSSAQDAIGPEDKCGFPKL